MQCVLSAAYQHANRLQQVDSVTGPAACGAAGDGNSRGQAGAVAAAARELRPVEIVGLYEEHKDRAEVLLGCLPAHAVTQRNSQTPNMPCNFLPANF